MKRVLLAWEAGSGRGHVVKLAKVARALAGLAQCDAALGWMDHAAEIAPHVDLVFRGARLPLDAEGHRQRRAPPNATWADYLADCHFTNPDKLRRNVEWWVETIRVRRIALLVGDYAPRALMAARIAGVPAIAIGTGYGLPPAHLAQFPPFLPEYTEREADEAAMVAAINAALAPIGYPAIAHLPQIYARDDEILRTLPLFDPYAGAREAPVYHSPLDAIPSASGAGREVFCYFSSREFQNPALGEALARCGLPLFGYLPTAPDDVRSRLAAAGAQISEQPVKPAQIAARARLMFTSGQHGVLALGLGAGIAQLCLPQHLEHLFMARQAEALGAARVIWPRPNAAEPLIAALHQAWEDTGLSAKAQAASLRVAQGVVPGDEDALRERVRRWL